MESNEFDPALLRFPKKPAHPLVLDFFDRCAGIVSLLPPSAALRRFRPPAPFFLWNNILSHAINTVHAKNGIERVRSCPLAPFFCRESSFDSPFGGLAQLVERLLRKQEVTGSTPVISTRKTDLFRQVGFSTKSTLAGG